MTTEAVLGTYTLDHPLMNAAGTCKSLEDVREFARSAVSAITLGSITLEPREGNAGDVYHQASGYSVNSLGMPNRGKQYYKEHLPEMAHIAGDTGKPLVVSVAGFRPAEYGELTDIAFDGGANLVELNLGCPNVWASGQQKPIPSFDPEAIVQIVNMIDSDDLSNTGVKLSPYSDPGKLAEVTAALNDLTVAYVVTCNTFPNTLVLGANYKSVIGVGLAGLSGAAMLPVGLGQVKQLREQLREGIGVIGVGGITTGEHIKAYLSVGADAVQASTAYWNAGCNPSVYSDILQDYVYNT